MAIESLSLLKSDGTKLLLAEKTKALSENISKNLISSKLQNKDLSGTPSAGTIIARRFANLEVKDYGSANAAQKGEKAELLDVDIKIDIRKELITEVENSDIAFSGIDGFLKRLTEKHEESIGSYLEDLFFDIAAKEAEKKNVIKYKDSDKIEDVAEALIQGVETTKTKLVNGIKRNYIALVVSPHVYGKLRTYIDKIKGSDDEEFFVYHGVEIYSSVYLPKGVDGIAMRKGAVARPVWIKAVAPTKPTYLDSVVLGHFLYGGCKVVDPELIYTLKKDTSTASA